jgi:DNA-dependent RNA polymerase auxiliary subunit epsilon
MDEKKVQIRLEIPGKDDPGFLKRARKALIFREKLAANDGFTVEILDSIVDFILDYVKEPQDREEAKDVLFDLSQEQFYGVLGSVGGIGGDDENPTSAQTSGLDTNPGSEETEAQTPGE